MGKGAGGGLFGSSGTTRSSQSQVQDISNFRPFQQPAIQAVFDALNPSLLGVPPAATQGVAGAQAVNFNNLLQSLRQPANDEFRSIIDIVNQDISAEPFEDVIDRFESIGNRAEDFRNVLLGGSDARFNRISQPNQAIPILRGQLGLDPAARAIDFLLPTARGDFLNANPFFEEGVVQPSVDDARNSVATLLSGGGRLRGSGNAAQSIARETGRTSAGLRSNQFNVERGLQQQAQQLIGGFDTNEALRKLNVASQIGQFDQNDRTSSLNLASTIANLFNPQLAAAQGITGAVAADRNRRQGLLGLRSGAASGLAGLQQQAIANAPLLAQSQTELPFIPLTNFSNIAFQPLGTTGTVNTTGTQRSSSSGSPFSSILGAGLTGAGLLGSGPLSFLDVGGLGKGGGFGADQFLGPGFATNPVTFFGL